MIETTDPAKGYFVPTERTKEDYVNQLVKMKYLEQNYVSRVGIEKAFNEFFYGKTNVSIVEAVGLLYYNTAIKEAEAKNYPDAYSAIFKSHQLYPAKKSEYMKVAFLSEVVRNLKMDNIGEWEALLALSQITNDVDNREYLKYKFSEAMEKYLLKGSMKSKTDSIYNYLFVNLKDSTLKSEIEEHYLQETSRFLYISNKYDQAKTYLEKAVVKNPNNAFTKSMLTDYILRREITNMGSSQNIKKLDEWTSRFDFLKKNENVQSAYLYNYTFMCIKHMENEQFLTAEKHYRLMANLLIANEHLDKNEELLGQAITGAAYYYFTKKQKQKVIEALELGSKHCPNNSEFQLMFKNKAKLLAKM
jgi:tetratricopeptide (TPR) repeat protein